MVKELSSSVIEEVSQVSHTQKYSLSIKRVTWITISIIVIMAVLYPFTSFPPHFENYFSIMYFHSIGVSIAALAVYLVISLFNLQKYEPPLDFPLHYRAFTAVIFAALGGLLYLNPMINTYIEDIPLGLFIVAFILIGDAGGALFVELFILPRKLMGVYPGKNNYCPRCILKIFPLTRKELESYRHMDSTYWLTLAAVGSAFIAGLIGFVNLWIRIFGLSFFSGYAFKLGLDATGFLGATLDPHSHEIALAIMAGVIALTAKQFNISKLNDAKRYIINIGLWISFIGVVAMTIVFLAISFANYEPPTFFQSGPQGINGIAGDDACMSIIALGSMIIIIPLALTKMIDRRSSWKDPIRISILGSWVIAYIINIFQAFYIELNQSLYSTVLSANDEIFSIIQPLFGIFVLTAISIILLIADYYQIIGVWRRFIGWLMSIGLVIAFIGAFLWIFVNPIIGSSFWIYFIGLLIIGVSATATIYSVKNVKIIKTTRSEIQ